MLSLIVALLILAALVWRWRQVRLGHEVRIQQMRVRIHVNGTRGKSTVTRLIAGVLREGGYQTLAKTSGSAARVIHEDGSESPIRRRGAATIVELVDIIRCHVTPNTEALAVECMAVNPIYQKVAQEQIVKGNITVITNVREDHQDVMGDTLPEIADSLSSTIPGGGLLITAEDRQALRDQLARNARARGSRFVYADPAGVDDDDLQGFGYLMFKENLAIGLAVADELNIARDVAMRGMHKALPDAGAVFVRRVRIGAKEIIWAPLFAVNDRESTIMGLQALCPYYKPQATRIGVLNNHDDRAVRALKFAEIAAVDLKLDYYVTLGAYEEQVTERMVELGYPRERIANLGSSRNPTLQQIVDEIVGLVQGDQALLVGMVNSHTPQAELLTAYLNLQGEQAAAGGWAVPESVHRRRYLIGHLLRQTERG